MIKQLIKSFQKADKVKRIKAKNQIKKKGTSLRCKYQQRMWIIKNK